MRVVNHDKEKSNIYRHIIVLKKGRDVYEHKIHRH